MPIFKADFRMWATVRLEAKTASEAEALMNRYVGEGAFVEIDPAGEEIDVGDDGVEVWLSPFCTSDKSVIGVEEDD